VLSARTNVSVVATVEGGWHISEMITVQRIGCCCVVVCCCGMESMLV
jgi:hypothetical protein